MGIIGVVAALTLPNLNSSTGDREKVAKVKKIYQNLNDAFGRAQAVYGPYDEWFVNDTTDVQKSKRFGERMTEFMKVSKDCAMEKGCFTSGNSKGLDGDNAEDLYNKDSHYKIITADGTSIAFWSRSDDTSFVEVDIDGPNKGPYTYGKDVFAFTNIDAGGNRVNAIYPLGTYGTFDDILYDVKVKGGSLAATWIINYDNMDYLKLKNGKCPNGTELTESNPRCK